MNINIGTLLLNLKINYINLGIIMKRSEVINQISIALDTGDEQAEEMLRIVELAGMSPPYYKKYYYTREEAHHTLDEDFGKDSKGCYIIKHEWEPENEKK
jgi:hypothetical protein